MRQVHAFNREAGPKGHLAALDAEAAPVQVVNLRVGPLPPSPALWSAPWCSACFLSLAPPASARVAAGALSVGLSGWWGTGSLGPLPCRRFHELLDTNLDLLFSLKTEVVPGNGAASDPLPCASQCM